MKVTYHDLQKRVDAGHKVTALAVYDAAFARQVSQAGIDIMLVGDSLGQSCQGAHSTTVVRTQDIVYHLQGVVRANQGALVMADMPLLSYADNASAIQTAAALMRAGAQVVKLEGGGAYVEIVRYLTERGVPVCAHLGLTPQTAESLGGFKVQGRSQAQAKQLLSEAQKMESAGAVLLVLECVPARLGTQVAAALRIPVIGIGAGVGCDGQILVSYDMLGLYPGAKPYKFVKDFLSGQADGITGAIVAFRDAVRAGTFPTADHSFE